MRRSCQFAGTPCLCILCTHAHTSPPYSVLPSVKPVSKSCSHVYTASLTRRGNILHPRLRGSSRPRDYKGLLLKLFPYSEWLTVHVVAIMSDYSVSLPSVASESQLSLAHTLESIEDEELRPVDWAPSSPNWVGGGSNFDVSALPTSAFRAHHAGYELSIVDQQRSNEASFDSDSGFYGYGASLPTPEIKPLNRAPTDKIQRISNEDERSSEDVGGDDQSFPYLTYQPSPELSGTSAVLSRWLTDAIRDQRDGREGGNERPHEEGSSRRSSPPSEGWAKLSGSDRPQDIFIDRDPYPLSGSELEGRSSVSNSSAESRSLEGSDRNSNADQPVYYIDRPMTSTSGEVTSPQGNSHRDRDLRGGSPTGQFTYFIDPPTPSASEQSELAETNSALIESSGPVSAPPAPPIATTNLISERRVPSDPYREENYRAVREQYQKWTPERSDASNKQYKPFTRLIVSSGHSKSTTSIPMQTQARTSSSAASTVPTIPPFSDLIDIPDEISGSTRFDAPPSRATQTTRSLGRGSTVDRPTRARSRYTQRFHNFIRMKGWRSDSSTSGAASNVVSASANERGITRYWAKTSHWVTGARSVMSHYASRHAFSRIGYS